MGRNRSSVKVRTRVLRWCCGNRRCACAALDVGGWCGCGGRPQERDARAGGEAGGYLNLTRRSQRQLSPPRPFSGPSCRLEHSDRRRPMSRRHSRNDRIGPESGQIDAGRDQHHPVAADLLGVRNSANLPQLGDDSRAVCGDVARIRRPPMHEAGQEAARPLPRPRRRRSPARAPRRPGSRRPRRRGRWRRAARCEPGHRGGRRQRRRVAQHVAGAGLELADPFEIERRVDRVIRATQAGDGSRSRPRGREYRRAARGTRSRCASPPRRLTAPRRSSRTPPQAARADRQGPHRTPPPARPARPHRQDGVGRVGVGRFRAGGRGPPQEPEDFAECHLFLVQAGECNIRSFLLHWLPSVRARHATPLA